jgi:hypothetical protein
MKHFYCAADPFDALAEKASRVMRLKRFWRNLYFSSKLLLIVIALAILAIPFCRPAMRALKVRNYRTDLASAKQALAEGRSTEARELALQVLRNNPQKSEALPIFMRALEGAGDSRLMMAAREYLSQNTEGRADRIFAWNVLSKQSPMGIAAMNWLSLREAERKDPDFLVPWLERLATEGLGSSVAAELARQTTQNDPRVERIRLSLLARQATGVSLRALQARLLERIASHPDDGPQLLDVMDELPQSALVPYSFTALGKWIEVRGDRATVEEKLRLARCEIAANPDSEDPVLARMVSSYGGSNPVQVAKLYNTLGHFEKARELLVPALTNGDPDAFRLMASVVERLGKLDEWDKLLENPPEGSSQAEAWCDRAYIASKKGDRRAKIEFQQKALAAAELEAKSDSLIRLARHAQNRGLVDYAMNTWVTAIQRGSASPLPLFQSLDPVIRMATAAKKESQLLDILRIYRSAEPGNLEVAIQCLYLGCLLGNTPPVTLINEFSPVRERLLEDAVNPTTLALDCTIALANLLKGNSEVAARLTGGRDVDWFDQIPAHRAIRAIALNKTGCGEEAAIYLEGFNWDVLLPSEMRVFRKLLKPAGERGGANAVPDSKKAEKAKLAEEARQAKRNAELKEIREKLAERAAKEASEARQNGKDDPAATR